MSDIIFIRPRDEYGSYRDLYTLVRLSGYPLLYVDEADYDSDNCYIFSTPQSDWWTNIPHEHKARVIYYDLEFYDDFDTRKVPNGIELWSADPAYAKHHGIRYVMFGGDKRLAGYEHDGLWLCPDYDYDAPKHFDTTLLGHMVWRRQVIQGQLVEIYAHHKAEYNPAPNDELSGQRRHDVLKQTRAMVHVHQRDNWKRHAPQRYALAAAYHMPLFSETVIDMGKLDLSHVFYSDHANLAQHVYNWLDRNDWNLINTYSQALHQRLCYEYTFKKCIEAAV